MHKQFIFENQDYNRPFFVTYINMAAFSSYLYGFICISPWRRQCLSVWRYGREIVPTEAPISKPTTSTTTAASSTITVTIQTQSNNNNTTPHTKLKEDGVSINGVMIIF